MPELSELDGLHRELAALRAEQQRLSSSLPARRVLLEQLRAEERSLRTRGQWALGHPLHVAGLLGVLLVAGLVVLCQLRKPDTVTYFLRPHAFNDWSVDSEGWALLELLGLELRAVGSGGRSVHARFDALSDERHLKLSFFLDLLVSNGARGPLPVFRAEGKRPGTEEPGSFQLRLTSLGVGSVDGVKEGSTAACPWVFELAVGPEKSAREDEEPLLDAGWRLVIEDPTLDWVKEKLVPESGELRPGKWLLLVEDREDLPPHMPAHLAGHNPGPGLDGGCRERLLHRLDPMLLGTLLFPRLARALERYEIRPGDLVE